MKNILCNILYISIFIIVLFFVCFFLDKKQEDTIKEINFIKETFRETIPTFVSSFKDEIYRWTNKADRESNIVKESIYRSLAMSNLYFLQPYISTHEYEKLSLHIKDKIDPRVPRYLNPELVLSIVSH